MMAFGGAGDCGRIARAPSPLPYAVAASQAPVCVSILSLSGKIPKSRALTSISHIDFADKK